MAVRLVYRRLLVAAVVAAAANAAAGEDLPADPLPDPTAPFASRLRERSQLPAFDPHDHVELFHLSRATEVAVFPDLRDVDGTALTYHSTSVGLGVRRAARRYQGDDEGETSDAETTVFFAPSRILEANRWETHALFPGLNESRVLRWNNTGDVFALPTVSTNLWDDSTYMGVCSGLTFDFLADWMLAYTTDFCQRVQQLHVANPRPAEGNRRAAYGEAATQHLTIGEATVLPSCTSHDFVFRVYQFLAEMGLPMRPLIEPRVEAMTFYAAVPTWLPAVDWTKFSAYAAGATPPLSATYFLAASARGHRRHRALAGSDEDEAAVEDAEGATVLAEGMRATSWVLARTEDTSEADILAAEQAGVEVMPMAQIHDWYANISDCIRPKLQGFRKLKLTVLANFLSFLCLPSLPERPVLDAPEDASPVLGREVFIYVDGAFFLRIAVGGPLVSADEGRMVLPIASAQPVDNTSRILDWVIVVLLIVGAGSAVTVTGMRLGVCGKKYMAANKHGLLVSSYGQDDGFLRMHVRLSPRIPGRVARTTREGQVSADGAGHLRHPAAAGPRNHGMPALTLSTVLSRRSGGPHAAMDALRACDEEQRRWQASERELRARRASTRSTDGLLVEAHEEDV